MSRIIKEGKLPTYRMKCAVCGCKFQFTEQDVSKIYSTHGNFKASWSEISYFKYVDCPFCHERRILKSVESAAKQDFIEDVKALAKQYGYELINIEVK